MYTKLKEPFGPVPLSIKGHAYGCREAEPERCMGQTRRGWDAGVLALASMT